MTGIVTYRQLDQLLVSVGFQPAAANKQGGQIYRHCETETKIVLGKFAPSQMVRGADLVSVRRHLVESGLLDEHTFGEFARNGVIPICK